MKLLIIFSLLGFSLAYNYNENKPRQLNCDCGWKNDKIDRAKNQVQYPWVAGIIKWSGFYCAATIVTEWHVLTTSICTGIASPSDLSFCVGTIDKEKCLKDSSVIRHNVENYYKHWILSNNEALNDLAIILSMTKIEFNSFVGPACIPRKHYTNEKLLDYYVKIFSWGSTETIKELDMQVIPEKECAPMHLKVDNLSHICTYETEQFICDKDRSGPVVLLDSVTKRYQLIGMVTYSPFKCPEKKPKPTLSTNVSAFLKWMEKHIKQDKPDIEFCTRS